ncbi:GlxA family transcriptional regulator [Actinoplanes philippinensis]|uniref:GlxA family transcriptional regulator n=1 Tax=Actinoplanes philippinensis TaxID=35752 RepID=UPI0034053BE0
MSSENKGGRRVIVLVLPEVNLLDLGGPVQAFDAAAHLGADYRLEFAAVGAGEVRSAQGLHLAGLDPLPETGPGDLVLVPGPRLRASGPDFPQTAVTWVRAAVHAGARVASVCTGAAVLAEAGVLDGRRCTTHWSLVDLMRSRYPRARVRDAVLYVHDGPVSTSAGIAAGIDLALSLIERDHGPSLTAAVARALVVYLRRDGSQRQVSAFLEHRGHLHAGVHRVQDHLAQHLDSPHTLDELRRRMQTPVPGLGPAATPASAGARLPTLPV